MQFKNPLDKAHFVANATEFNGDHRVHIFALKNAAKVLSDRVKVLEAENERLSETVELALDNPFLYGKMKP